jgi:hypothetical protein
MYKTFRTAVADTDNSATMESGNHSKNGVSPKNQTSRGNFLILAVAIFALSSCTTISESFHVFERVHVGLDTYSNQENTTGKKIAMIACNDESISKHDLKNQEFEKYLKKILAPKGYSFTDSSDTANVVIFYEYGISDPKIYTSQEVIPVWGQTGVSSSKTETRTDFSGRPYAHTTYEPSYGVVGSNVVTNTEIKYMRWANVSAFDADYYRKTGGNKMIWLTEMRSEGETDDLRMMLPYLLTAARKYIGENHTNRINITLNSDPVSAEVLSTKNALVVVFTHQATSGRKDPQATIDNDVYRAGQLYIKKGEPVSIKRTRAGRDLLLSRFSTTSVDGNKVSLKGYFLMRGKSNHKIRHIGKGMTILSVFLLSPISIPLMCVGDAHAKVPVGTYFSLEME